MSELLCFKQFLYLKYIYYNYPKNMKNTILYNKLINIIK